jgi:hypothetical protein
MIPSVIIALSFQLSFIIMNDDLEINVAEFTVTLNRHIKSNFGKLMRTEGKERLVCILQCRDVVLSVDAKCEN